MTLYAMYLILTFGGSSTSTVIIPVADMVRCITAGEKAVRDGERVSFICVEGVRP
jgi:hypothetical protein